MVEIGSVVDVAWGTASAPLVVPAAAWSAVPEVVLAAGSTVCAALLVVGFGLDVLLIPPFGASGAAAAASAAFLLGGATALLAYRSRTPFAWRSLLIPRQGDLDFLGALIRLPFRLRARPS